MSIYERNVRKIIMDLRDKISYDRTKLTDEGIAKEKKFKIVENDELLQLDETDINLTDNCRDSNYETPGNLLEKKKEKLLLPLKEIDKNVKDCCSDLREQKKEKLRQIFICSGDKVSSNTLKAPFKAEKRMVRYGEYSPRNPNLVPADKPLLALGDYEERRRLLLEQKKKEYKQQMDQARINMKTSKKKVRSDDQMEGNDYISLPDVGMRNHPYDSKVVSLARKTNTASTQTENFEDFHLEVTSPLSSTGSVSPVSAGSRLNVNSEEQCVQGYYPSFGNNSSPLSPLTLNVHDEPSLASPKLQCLSPRERKLAELRGSENYSHCFYGFGNYKSPSEEAGARALQFYQPEDKQMDPKTKHQAYHEELRQQIEEKKRLEALQKEKERMEDEALMKRLEQQQERMKREYEQEKAERLIKQTQKLHIAEEFKRRQEELQYEAHQLREEEMRRKRGIIDTEAKKLGNQFHEEASWKPGVHESQFKELEKNLATDNSGLSHSLPVPTLRTKLLSEMNSVYQSPKEVTQILNNNFPKAHSYSQTVHISGKLPCQSPEKKNCKERSKRHRKHCSRKCDKYVSEVDSDVSEKPMKPVTSGPEDHLQPLYYNVPFPSMETKTRVEPVERKRASSEHRTAPSDHRPLQKGFFEDNEYLNEMPLSPRDYPQTSDITSEARPSNILTQLGDFRRQLQIDHTKMQAELRKSFSGKSSSF